MDISVSGYLELEWLGLRNWDLLCSHLLGYSNSNKYSTSFYSFVYVFWCKREGERRGRSACKKTPVRSCVSLHTRCGTSSITKDVPTTRDALNPAPRFLQASAFLGLPFLVLSISCRSWLTVAQSPIMVPVRPPPTDNYYL